MEMIEVGAAGSPIWRAIGRSTARLNAKSQTIHGSEKP